MDMFLRRVLIYTSWTFILFNIANGLTCGQTKCSDGEHCCSKDEGEENNCCCKSSATGFTRHCYSGTSVQFPWWAGVIIGIVVIAIIAAVVIILYRRRRRQAA
ncbi:uncharacterized protein LOC123564630 [Mercenaria mercenaria]|uniref:uncharacterized protein LOC123564630 n=1 Tax=Mercenaria mercenaria TaxID=6596 RepID=UPI001E1D53BD|nr:uncharacterized protein LOC123564630 [Mercenaria mercenaria]